jgi:hypothetical protein
MLATQPADTIGLELEIVRLRHRASRIQLVIARLRERVVERRRAGDPIPSALGHAIHGFEIELQATRDRLSELGVAIHPD